MKKLIALFTAAIFALTLGVAFAADQATAPTGTEKAAPAKKAKKKKAKKAKKAAKEDTASAPTATK